MVRKVSYGDNITLDEARQHLEEVREELTRVRGHYTGPRAWLRRHFTSTGRNMLEEDQRALTDCVGGVILPLTTIPSVQEEIRKTGRYEGTLQVKATETMSDIFEYMAEFPNTGVKLIGRGPVPFD